MIESIAPRTGENPLTMAAIAPATSTYPQQNPINGHEKNNDDGSDLQFACIFVLPTPVVCQAGQIGCDCAPDKAGDVSYLMAENSPICQPPAGGPPGSTQYYAKAYPGTRELRFAKLMGERAVGASICPRSLSTPDSPDDAYGPAFTALIGRIAKTVK